VERTKKRPGPVEPLVQCVGCHLSVCLSVCNVLYCGKTVRPSQKVSEEVNRKPGSKSSFLGSPPYFYFRFRRYSHQNGRFCLIFARTAQQSVLDGTNGLSSSNPCAYGRILRSELKPGVVLALDLCSVNACFRHVVLTILGLLPILWSTCVSVYNSQRPQCMTWPAVGTGHR